MMVDNATSVAIMPLFFFVCVCVVVVASKQCELCQRRLALVGVQDVRAEQ